MRYISKKDNIAFLLLLYCIYPLFFIFLPYSLVKYSNILIINLVYYFII